MAPGLLLHRFLGWTSAGLCLVGVLLVGWALLDPLEPDWRMGKAIGFGALSACVFRLRHYLRREPVPGWRGGTFTREEAPISYHLAFVVFILLIGFLAWLGLR